MTPRGVGAECGVEHAKSTDPSGVESVLNAFGVIIFEGAECGEFLSSTGVYCLLDYSINNIRPRLWLFLVF